ncbi:MAG TPA: M36 family metallopeptidase, partial [Actinomycetota bacterium]|nr:M36 family metallopeptidase [Actinomycetota bacterium]
MSLRSPRVVLLLALALALVSSAPAGGAGTTTADAVSTALAHLEGNAGSVGATSADVRDLVVTSAYTSKHNGVTHVNVNQAYAGLEVFGAHATVNVTADGSVAFVGGGFERGLSVASSAAELDAADAAAAAADALGLADPEGLRVLSLSLGGAQESVVSGGGISDEPITARLGWQPTKAGLRLAWQLVIDSSADASLWNATVDAATGRLLDVEDWTSHDSYEDLESTMGATLARSASASALADIEPPVSTNPGIDGSSSRVFQLPVEGPNDGDRTLVENPADGDASPYGWHDTDGVAGPEFTITRGNNNHAYLDQDANNQPDPGQDADGGAGLDFDFPVDFAEHSQAYRDAVVTNLFYGCNMVHDLMWLYGFDEPSGN